MTASQVNMLYPAAATLCAVIGSVFDVKSRRIPNFITGPAILFGLSLHLALGGWSQLASAFAAGLICGFVFLIFYLAGGMGAGDVKLILAVGCIAGLSHTAYLLVLTAISGGFMALCLAMARGRLQQTLMNVAALTHHHTREGLTPHPELNILNANTLRLPYALAIAGGTFLTLFFQIR